MRSHRIVVTIIMNLLVVSSAGRSAARGYPVLAGHGASAPGGSAWELECRTPRRRAVRGQHELDGQVEQRAEPLDDTATRHVTAPPQLDIRSAAEVRERVTGDDRTDRRRPVQLTMPDTVGRSRGRRSASRPPPPTRGAGTGPLSSPTALLSSANRCSSMSSTCSLIAASCSSANAPQSNRKGTPPGRSGLGRRKSTVRLRSGRQSQRIRRTVPSTVAAN